MLPLIRLKNDVRFSQELLGMMDVLKAATARQFRVLQGKKKSFEPFKEYLEEFIVQIGSTSLRHPFLEEQRSLPKAIVMITSEEGFLGGLNANVVNAALEQAAPTDELIVLGERGARHLSENYTGDFTVLPGMSDDMNLSRIIGIRDMLIQRFLARQVGRVLVTYPRFVSITVQEPGSMVLLPCQEMLRAAPSRETDRRPPVLIEPNATRALDYLVRALLLQKLGDMFWESRLAEAAARIIHLEGSHQEILTYYRQSIRSYFRYYHEKSDEGIREVFASHLKRQEGAYGSVDAGL